MKRPDHIYSKTLPNPKVGFVRKEHLVNFATLSHRVCTADEISKLSVELKLPSAAKCHVARRPSLTVLQVPNLPSTCQNEDPKESSDCELAVDTSSSAWFVDEEDDIETLVGTDLVKLTTKVAVWRLAGSASSIRDELPELLRLFPPTVFHKYDVEPDC